MTYAGYTYGGAAYGSTSTAEISGTATATYTATSEEEGVATADATATLTYTATPDDEAVAEPTGTAQATYTATANEFVISNVSGTANPSYSTEGVVTFPLATEGVLWYINRRDESTATALNGETSTFPNVTIGEDTTFSFYIKQSSGYPEPQGVGDAEERYNQVVEWGKYAGYATVNRTLSSVYFKENDYPDADIDSLLVSIEPGDGVNQARGVWGIITGIDDSTEIFGAVARVDVSVTVLGQYDDYDDEAAVRAELEV
jgi:hypothetical protein